MNPGESILERIAARRRERLCAEGHTHGAAVPARREVPLVPPTGWDSTPFLICEIKRGSPSRGAIAPGLDALQQADHYLRQGVRCLSVLTEKDHFAGSLEDLIAVKRRFPEAAVLRKDFLLDEEDLEVSYRAGADAVLLIASLLDPEALRRLHRRAEALGLAALVELHDRADLARVRPLRPRLTGFNSRDLASFRLDPLVPLALRREADWQTCAVFESGIGSGEDVLVGRAAGFHGFLVGEAVVRQPQLTAELQRALAAGLPSTAGGDFWGRLSARRRPGRPLVKICGLTCTGDAELAAALGADLLGFVFAPSPRRAAARVLRDLRDLPALKVAVVVPQREGALGAQGAHSPLLLPVEVRALLEQGLVDAVQLHGEEKPEECLELAFPYYKALRLREPADVAGAGRYRCPRVLADAWSPHARGGTGRQIPEQLVAALSRMGPLWLAGGLGPENVGGIVRRFRPELLDCSSRLESAPGSKDGNLMRRLFEEIEAAGEAQV